MGALYVSAGLRLYPGRFNPATSRFTALSGSPDAQLTSCSDKNRVCGPAETTYLSLN